jgi:putative transposase
VDFLVGSIRRERLDHLIVCNQAHLMRILQDYTSYYNDMRTHFGLERFTQPPRH